MKKERELYSQTYKNTSMGVTSKGQQVFNVPATDKEFLKKLKAYRNNGYNIAARGRGSRKEHGNAYGIEQDKAEWLAVYVKGVQRNVLTHHVTNELEMYREMFPNYELRDRLTKNIINNLECVAAEGLYEIYKETKKRR